MDVAHLPQVSTGVHAETAGSTTETVAFGSVFAGVAVLAVQLGLVLGAVGGVKHLAAKAFEGKTFLKNVSV